MDALDWTEDEIITRHKSWPEGTGLDRIVAKPAIRMLGVQEAMERHLDDPPVVVLPKRAHVEPPTRKMDRSSIRAEMARLEESEEIEIELEDLEILDDVDLLDDSELVEVEAHEIADPKSDVVPARSRPRHEPIPSPPESFPLHRLSDLQPVDFEREPITHEPAKQLALAPEPEPEPMVFEHEAESEPILFTEALVTASPVRPMVQAPRSEPKVIIDAVAESHPYSDLPATWSSVGLPAPVLESESAPKPARDDDWIKRSSSLAPLAREPRTLPPPQRRGGGWGRALGLAATALAGAAMVAAVVHFQPRLWPQSGGLRIDVAGPNVTLAGVFIDGQRKCDTTPCLVDGLEPGPRVIKIVLPNGDRVLTETHQVVAGAKRFVMMGETNNTPTPPPPPPQREVAAPLGRVVLASKLESVTVELDGKKRGALPVTLTDLSPGKHVLRFTAPRHKPIEKTLRVDAHETVRMDDVALPLETGSVRITSVTPGARLLLAPKNARRKALAGPFPKSFDVAPGNYDIIAIRPGFRAKVVPITISDDSPDVELTIELAPQRYLPRREDIYE